MHSNGFVLAVKDSHNQILREFKEEVYVNFGSEYSLLIKNLNDVKAKCSIQIDGSYAVENLVIPAHGDVVLERFQDQARKFKFVPASQSQDPSAGENGIIRATFAKEIIPVTWSSNNLYYSDSLLRGSYTTSNCIGVDASAGATVPGKISFQEFSQVRDFSCEAISTVLTLQLKGKDTSITTRDKNYCSSCGKRVGYADKYCSSCGVKL